MIIQRIYQSIDDPAAALDYDRTTSVMRHPRRITLEQHDLGGFEMNATRPRYRVPFWLSILIFVIGIGALYALFIRTYHMRWGASDAEVAMAMPGDALIAPEAIKSTRAVTIHAPAATVWAWLVQTGQNRGGNWHSYSWLENLFAAGMIEGKPLDPRWQQVQAGDQLYMHAGAANNPVMAVQVMGVEPGHALWLRGGWSFLLRPIDAQTTRLVVRYPMKPNELGNPLMTFGIFEPAHFVMEAGMLLGIKRLAEGDPQPAALSAH
jgi:hypothetical protein